MKKLIFAMIAGATAIGAAQAQTAAPGPYVGLGVVSAKHKLAVPGAAMTDNEDRKTSAKIFGGYEMDQNFGIEAGYTDMGKAKSAYSIGGVPAGTAETKGKAVYVAGKATAPINEQFSVFGKLGAAHTTNELNAPTVTRKDSDTGLYAGVGAQYNLNQQTALTLEYERYGEKKDFGPKPDAVTLAARFKF